MKVLTNNSEISLNIFLEMIKMDNNNCQAKRKRRNNKMIGTNN